jgi:hypothetical protein
MTFFLNPSGIGLVESAALQLKSVRPECIEGLRKGVSAGIRMSPFETFRVTGSVLRTIKPEEPLFLSEQLQVGRSYGQGNRAILVSFRRSGSAEAAERDDRSATESAR